jgi:hypothetical protein
MYDAKHHFIYQTTNLVNEHFYIGVHNTNNMNDGYLGSGDLIRAAIKKHGRDSFKRIILGEFDNPKDALDIEALIVNEDFIARKDTYNICLGGFGGTFAKTKGMKFVRVKSSGKICWVKPDDPRFQTGEIESTWVGKRMAKNIKTNKNMKVDKDDPRWETGELQPLRMNVGKTCAVNKDGEIFRISVDDKRLETGELVSCMKGTVTVKEVSTGKHFRVKIDDPRIEKGELVYPTKGLKQSNVQKEKIRNERKTHCHAIDKNGKILYIKNTDPRLETGELKYTHYSIGKVVCVDKKTGKKIQTTWDDLRVISGELIPFLKGRKVYRSKITGEVRRLADNDSRLKTNEWESFSHMKGKPKSEEQKKKQSEAKKSMVKVITPDGQKIKVKVTDDRIKTGELKLLIVVKTYYRKQDGTIIYTFSDSPEILRGEWIRHRGKVR